MGKKIVWGVVVLLVVIIAVVGGFLYFSGDVIKAAVEKLGPEMTKAKVTLDKVDISFTSGEGTLSGLFVGNPSGFKTDHAFQLGKIGVKVDTGSITSDTVVIKSIVIDAPDVTYELAGGTNNLDAIQKNVTDYTGGGGGGGGGSSEGGKKLVIEDLRIQNGKVNVSASFLQGKSLSAPLPTIHMTNIGKDSGGASPAEVAKKIIASITSAATKAVQPLNLDDMAKKAGEALSGATKAIGESTSGATGTMKEGAGAVGDKIKGLLGK
jgi:hypothetical protein